MQCGAPSPQLHALDLLTRQLDRYTRDEARGNCPLNLEACMDGDVIVEPIGALVASCHRCARTVLEASVNAHTRYQCTCLQMCPLSSISRTIGRLPRSWRRYRR